jgi:hypothetical protein
MNGFIKQSAAVSVFATALVTVLGCAHYREVVDPCWPERYNSLARQSIRDMHNAQADLGHKLDQTVWDHHFDAGTDVLNSAGKDQLRYLSRRQPIPDFQIYLQWPHDVSKDRDALIAKRKDAIRNFLTTQTMVGNGKAYNIEVHDLPVPTYPSEWTEAALRKAGQDITKGMVTPGTGSGGTGVLRP